MYSIPKTFERKRKKERKKISKEIEVRKERKEKESKINKFDYWKEENLYFVWRNGILLECCINKRWKEKKKKKKRKERWIDAVYIFSESMIKRK